MNNNNAKGQVWVPKNLGSYAGNSVIGKNNNNNNAGKKRKLKVPKGVSVTRDLPTKAAVNQALQKVNQISRNGGSLKVSNGAVQVTMAKNKVDRFLDQFLLPENAKRVLPFGTSGKNVGQFVGAAMSLDLQNGLGTAQTQLRSYVACTANPEAPLLVATNTPPSHAMDNGQWCTIESHTVEVSHGPGVVGGNIWLANTSGPVGFELNEAAHQITNFTYNDVTFTKVPVFKLRIGKTNALSLVSLQSMPKCGEGTAYFMDNNGNVTHQINYEQEGLNNLNLPVGDYKVAFVQNGSLDLGIKVVNSSGFAGQLLSLSLISETAMKPLISSAYTAVAASDSNSARVVSSAVCLTYAPDMQYGGGSLVSAVLEPAQPGSLSNWESYIYSRRRSYMSKALLGNYTVCLPTARSLAFENTKRHNYFYSDGNALAISFIQYKPANAGVNVDALNMQVKGHVWYDYTTSDNSRSQTAFLDQDEICQRMFTGLTMVFRPSENPKHTDYVKFFANAWHWLNGGSDEATALRKAAGTVGKGLLATIPTLLAAL